MTNTHFCIGNQALNHTRNFAYILNAIVDEIHLSTAFQFISNRIAYNFLIESYHISFNRISVRWWSGNYG